MSSVASHINRKPQADEGFVQSPSKFIQKGLSFTNAFHGPFSRWLHETNPEDFRNIPWVMPGYFACGWCIKSWTSMWIIFWLPRVDKDLLNAPFNNWPLYNRLQTMQQFLSPHFKQGRSCYEILTAEGCSLWIRMQHTQEVPSRSLWVSHYVFPTCSLMAPLCQLLLIKAHLIISIVFGLCPQSPENQQLRANKPVEVLI